MIDQQAFQRLRRRLQNTSGSREQALLAAGSAVTMPSHDRQMALLQKITEPFKLVIDQSFQRADIERADGACGLLVQDTEQRQKGGLSFPGRRARCQEQMGVGAKDNLTSHLLRWSQIGPALRINVILDEGGKLRKEIHRRQDCRQINDR